MKTLWACLIVFVITAAAAQEKPKQQHRKFAALIDRPVEIQMTSGFVSVEGSWVALDERSTLAGPSVSRILCDKAESTCHESQSNITIIDNQFTLSADSVDYKIARWDSKEIVAQNISGVCRVLHVLKFDLQNKKVYTLDSLSEPVEDLPKMARDACNAIWLRLELRGGTSYSLDAR